MKLLVLCNDTRQFRKLTVNKFYSQKFIAHDTVAQKYSRENQWSYHSSHCKIYRCYVCGSSFQTPAQRDLPAFISEFLKGMFRSLFFFAFQFHRIIADFYYFENVFDNIKTTCYVNPLFDEHF